MSRFTDQELEWCRIAGQLDKIETSTAIVRGQYPRPAHDVPAIVAKEVNRLVESIGGADMKVSGSRCVCTACGEGFNRVSTFDKHRTGRFAPPGEWSGNRRCMTPAEMEAKGWQRNSAGFWITASGNWRRA